MYFSMCGNIFLSSFEANGDSFIFLNDTSVSLKLVRRNNVRKTFSVWFQKAAQNEEISFLSYVPNSSKKN